MRFQNFNDLLDDIVLNDDDRLILLEDIPKLDQSPCYQTLSRWVSTGILPKPIVVRRKRYIRKKAWRELLLAQEG